MHHSFRNIICRYSEPFCIMYQCLWSDLQGTSVKKHLPFGKRAVLDNCLSPNHFDYFLIHIYRSHGTLFNKKVCSIRFQKYVLIMWLSQNSCFFLKPVYFFHFSLKSFEKLENYTKLIGDHNGMNMCSTFSLFKCLNCG